MENDASTKLPNQQELVVIEDENQDASDQKQAAAPNNEKVLKEQSKGSDVASINPTDDENITNTRKNDQTIGNMKNKEIIPPPIAINGGSTNYMNMITQGMTQMPWNYNNHFPHPVFNFQTNMKPSKPNMVSEIFSV